MYFVISVAENKQKESPTLYSNIATNCYWKKVFLNFGSKKPQTNPFGKAAVRIFLTTQQFSILDF